MTESDILDHPELRKVWDRLETESPSVDWDALSAHRSPDRLPMRRRRSSGLTVAAAVFALVLLFGGVAWLTRVANDPIPGGPLANLDWDLMATFPAPADAETSTDQVESIEGVESVEYYANAAVFWSNPAPTDSEDLVETTIEGSIPVGEEPIVAALLIQLQDPRDAERVAHVLDQEFETYSVEYSPELAAAMADEYFEATAEAAVVIGEDPLTLQPTPGPEPEFDTKGLGAEVELLPAADAREIPEMFWDLSSNAMLDDGDVRSPDSPVFHIGYLEDLDIRMVVYRSVGGDRCINSLMPGGGAGGGCGDDFSRYQYGGRGYGGIDGETGYFDVEVPLETSVVAVTVDGGSPMWQRPVAGWAVFPVEIHDYDHVEFTVEAFDAFGANLGRWEEQG